MVSTSHEGRAGDFGRGQRLQILTRSFLPVEANPERRGGFRGTLFAALISVCIHLRCHSHPKQRWSPPSASTAPASGNSRGTKSAEPDPSPPHPSGSRLAFDQAVTRPPSVQGTGERARSCPWALKCPVHPSGLLAEPAPGSVWLPAGSRRAVCTSPA